MPSGAPGSEPRLRIALIGAGRVAWTGHIPALQGLPEFELVAVHDLDARRLALLAERLPLVRAEPTPDRILDAGEVDAVIIATPPESHLELATQALERGLAVYLEKPMVRSVAEATELAAVVRRTSGRLAVGHQMRFHPTYRRLAGILNSGEIGVPYFIGFHWATNVKLDPEHLVPAGYDNYRWRWSDPTVGGGIVQDHLPHVVDLVRYWTGEEPDSTYAHTTNVARDLLDWDPAASRWEDFGIVLVRFGARLALRLETGTVGRSLSPIWSLGSGVGEWTQYGYVLGSRGQLVFDMLPWDSSENGRLAVWTVDAARQGRGWSYVEQPEPPRTTGSPSGASGLMFRDQLTAFAAFTRGQPSAIATVGDGMVSVAVVEAAYESASSNQTTPIRSPDGWAR